MTQQIRNPLGILDVGLASRQRLHVRRVHQRQIDMPLQQIPYGLPVRPRALHRHVLALRGNQPVPELQPAHRTGSTSSAVALALMKKRDFAAVFFDTQILAEFRFERGKAAPEEIFRFATVGANGGRMYVQGWEPAARSHFVIDSRDPIGRSAVQLANQPARRLKSGECPRLPPLLGPRAAF